MMSLDGRYVDDGFSLMRFSFIRGHGESEVYNYFCDDKIKIRKLSDTSLISYSFWTFFNEKKANIL